MSIYNKLYDWQKHLVDAVYKRESLGLYLDMGLGKTPIALALAEKNKCTKIIIITVNNKACESVNVHGSWLYWTKQSDIDYSLSAKNKFSFNANRADCYIINYEALFERAKNRKYKIQLKPNICDFIASCKDHNTAIIIDESHKMKDSQSMQTSAIVLLKKFISNKAQKLFCYLLSGTPFTTGYIDLYSQLKFLGYKETKQTYKEKFCVLGNIPGLYGWQQPIVGYKNVDELYALIHNYAVTIQSDDVCDLPEQIYIDHIQQKSDDFTMFTTETIKQQALYDYIHMRLPDADLPKAENKKVNNPFYRDIAYDCTKSCGISDWYAETPGTFWLRSRQLSIGFNGNAEKSQWYNRERLNELENFLAQNNDNYLLFYNFTPEMIELYDICARLNYNIDVYCGEIKSLYWYNTYAAQSKEQQLTNKKNIILANFASGSTGLNWQCYNKCIIFSLPLYKDWAQGIKRIHRIGQEAKTTIYHVFWQNNWLDKAMRQALLDNIDYTEKIFERGLNDNGNN